MILEGESNDYEGASRHLTAFYLWELETEALGRETEIQTRIKNPAKETQWRLCPRSALPVLRWLRFPAPPGGLGFLAA